MSEIPGVDQFINAGTIAAIERAVSDIIATIVLVVIIVLAIHITVKAIGISGPSIGESMTSDMTDQQLKEVEIVSATEGAQMARYCGRRIRVPGVLIWVDDVEQYKEEVEVQETPTDVDRFRVNLAIAWGQAFGGVNGDGRVADIILVLFNGKTVWKKNKESKFDHRWESWTNYTGSQTQTANSLLEERIGSNRVSGFRDTAYSVIEGLRLEDFGNAIPASISAIIQPDDAGYTLADAITDIWNRQPSGDASAEIDVSTLTGKNTIAINEDDEYLFEGYRKIGPRSAIQMIEQMIPIFDLTVRQSGDRMEFLDRGDEPVVSIPSGKLGAVESFGTPTRPIEFTLLTREERPSEVVVNFLSKKHRYQRASERYKVNEAPSGENIVTLNYEGVLLPKQARRIAKRRVIEAYRLDKQAKVVLPPDFAYLDAGDVIAAPMEGQVYYIRAQQVTVGANYLVEVEGLVEQVRAGDDEILSTGSSDLGTDHDDPDSDEDDPLIDDPEGDDDGGYDPPLMRKVPMNLPPLFKDKEAKDTGIYYAHCAENPNVAFKGAKAYASWKASGGYSLFGTSLKEGSIGYALTALADSTAGPGQFLDRASVLRVQMFEGAPESATRSEVESGANWCAIGDITDDNFEVAAFLTATPVDPVVTDYTNTAFYVGAADTIVKASGPTFSGDLGIQVGDYVRIDGLTGDANLDIFRRVTSVDVHTMTLDITPGNLDTTSIPPADQVITLTQDSGVYDLSNWFRGLRDTYDHCSQHPAGDLVVFFSGASPSFVPRPKGKIGKTLRVKSVPKGAVIGDVLSESMVFRGETLRPFRPCWLKTEREFLGGDEMDDYDIIISWVHRTRFPDPDPTTEQVPHAELDHEGKQDEYEIRIYSDEAKTTLVRSFTVVAPDDHDAGDIEGRRSKTYTVAQQESDGVKNAELWCEIWQVGTVAKKGNVLDFYIPAI
jgi:hypothetical protein